MIVAEMIQMASREFEQKMSEVGRNWDTGRLTAELAGQVCQGLQEAFSHASPYFSPEGLTKPPCPGISVYTIILYNQDKEVNHADRVYPGVPSLSSPPPPRSPREF